MIRQLALECVGWDTARIEPNGPTAFFADRPGAEFSSATGTDEHVIVEALFADRMTRQLLTRTVGTSSSARWANRVRQPFIESVTNKPGDIDVLIVNQGAPQAAIVVEAKRVKIRADGRGGQRINKLEAAHGAADQVAGLVGFGFSRTYLMLIAVVDDRSDQELNFFFRGATSSTLRCLVEFTESVSLPAEAGILYVEMVQPLAKDYKSAALVCAGILKPAVVREQTEALTSKIASFLAANGRGI